MTFENRVFAEVMSLDKVILKTGGPLILYDWCLHKQGKFEDRYTQGKCHVKILTMLPQTKNYQKLQERLETDPSLLPSRDHGPLLIP